MGTSKGKKVAVRSAPAAPGGSGKQEDFWSGGSSVFDALGHLFGSSGVKKETLTAGHGTNKDFWSNGSKSTGFDLPGSGPSQGSKNLSRGIGTIDLPGRSPSQGAKKTLSRSANQAKNQSINMMDVLLSGVPKKGSMPDLGSDNWLYSGVPNAPKVPGKKKSHDDTPSAAGQPTRINLQPTVDTGPVQDPGPQTLEDWINYAKQLSGAAGNGYDYDGEISRQQARGNENDQYLGAMYRALQNGTKAELGNIGTSYGKAKDEVAHSAATATQNLTEAYKEAQSAGLQEANALGFGQEASAIQQSHAPDQAFRDASIQRVSQSEQNKLTDDQAASEASNRGWQNAAGMAGAEAQTLNHRHVDDIVAGLGQQKAEASNSRQQAILNLAMQLQSQAGSAAETEWQHQQKALDRAQAETEFVAGLKQAAESNKIKAQNSASQNLIKFLGNYGENNQDQGFEAYKTLLAKGLL